MSQHQTASHGYFHSLAGVPSLVWTTDTHHLIEVLEKDFYQGVPISPLYTLPKDIGTLEKAGHRLQAEEKAFQSMMAAEEHNPFVDKSAAVEALLNELTNPSAIRGIAALCYRHKRVAQAFLAFSENAAQDAELFGCLVDDSHGTVQMAGFLWQGAEAVEATVGEQPLEIWQGWLAKAQEGVALTPVTTKHYGIFPEETASTRQAHFETFLRGIYPQTFLVALADILA